MAGFEVSTEGFEHARGQVNPVSAASSTPNLVGNVFRAIRDLMLSQASVVGGDVTTKLARVRLPLLASGDQHANRGDMIEAVMRQAYLSLVGQSPVQRVKIVLRPESPDLHTLLVRGGRAFELVQAEWARHSALL